MKAGSFDKNIFRFFLYVLMLIIVLIIFGMLIFNRHPAAEIHPAPWEVPLSGAEMAFFLWR